MHPDLENIMEAFHDFIISRNPTMLPLYRKLAEEIHKDRTRGLEEKNRLLGIILAKNVVKVPMVTATRTTKQAHALNSTTGTSTGANGNPIRQLKSNYVTPIHSNKASPVQNENVPLEYVPTRQAAGKKHVHF